jgi:hypothetical protein
MRVYPGLMPWDVDRLSFAELEVLISHAAKVLSGGEGV